MEKRILHANTPILQRARGKKRRKGRREEEEEEEEVQPCAINRCKKSADGKTMSEKISLFFNHFFLFANVNEVRGFV